ncbi:MAG: abscisic acid-deficient protein Aba4 family protein [Nannocystaceae bacterium]
MAWVHFLAFDLFVGRWVLLDARERGLSSWLVSPTLVTVLMFGPLGLLLYLGLRATRRPGHGGHDRGT